MGITGKNRQKIILAIVIVIIAMLGFSVYRLSRTQQTSVSTAAGTFAVVRGDLVMNVTESGTIRARNAVEIKSEVERETTIVSIVPEGSYVTPEDVANKKVLVELDSSGLRDNMNSQKISFNSAKAGYTEAKEALVIQKNQNDSDIQQGLMNVKFARMDMQKYLGETTADNMVEVYRSDPNQRPEVIELLSDPNQLGGQSLQRYRELTSNIDLAREELERAEQDLYWTRQLYQKEYIAESELKTDELKTKRMKIQWEQAKTSLDLFIRYEFPKETERLFSDYLEAVRQLERIYAQTRSRLAQAEARLNSSEAMYLLSKEQLERIEGQIAACVMRATEPGLVIYAASSGRRWSGNRTNVEVGENVRDRELIMTITNANEMNVDVKVHETNVDKVRAGQAASIVIDAQPDKVFPGEVVKIAPLPDPQSFFGNPDLKVYTTEVSLETVGDSIKPGMSARVEILIAKLQDVLSIPVQCVANRSGKKVCYLMTQNGPKEQVIETGVFNDRFVHVISGLREGQKVLLSPPRLLAAKKTAEHTENSSEEQKGIPQEGPGKESPGKPGERKMPPSKGAPKSDAGNAADHMKKMDANGDGKIDLATEVPQPARQFTAPLDLNKDGFIDSKKMAAAAQKAGSGQNSNAGNPHRSQEGNGGTSK